MERVGLRSLIHVQSQISLQSPYFPLIIQPNSTEVPTNMSSAPTTTVLPVGVGYGVVVGIGFFFAAIMCGISWIQNRFTIYSTKTSEEFNTASRSVKPGLIASGIVSACTFILFLILAILV